MTTPETVNGCPVRAAKWQQPRTQQTMYEAIMKYEDVISFEALMQAADRCCQSVMWKSSTQTFKVNQARWAADLHRQLAAGRYKSRGFTNFTITERGKIRHIQSVHISERCVQKSLCQNALRPLIEPRLIYDNSASLPGKGTAFALRRLRKHLWQHYQKHGRTGGILLMDYSNYFGSIDHQILLQMLRDVIEDNRIYQLTKHFIDCFDGDVGLGLGSEVSQICAIFYPNKIDHYIKENLGIKGYGRYMDDSYIIHEDVDYLKQCLNDVERLANDIGLNLNRKRTHIIRLDGHFEYLKKRIHVTETGKVIMRPTRKNITKRRQLLRKHKEMLDAGQIDFATIRQSYQSWRGYAVKCNSYRTVRNMDELFDELFIAGFVSGKENHGCRICESPEKATGGAKCHHGGKRENPRGAAGGSGAGRRRRDYKQG